VNANQRYRINHPAVIAEVLDGEAIIVNLDSGAYYSLRDSGCAIWTLLTQQCTPVETVATIQTHYVGDADDIQSGVDALLVELLAESLLVPAEGAQPNAPVLDMGSPSSGAPPFTPPLLEKFTDMADLLLLDPIHEVDVNEGWPQPPKGQR
jgi:hypothetical protein